MPGCILVMCGLPGSGKTTLVSQLVPAAVSDKLSCVVVDYDRLMPSDVESSLIEKASQDEEAKLWKHYREAIVSYTDRFLSSVNPSKQRENDKEETLISENEALNQNEAVSKTEAVSKIQKEAVSQKEAVCQGEPVSKTDSVSQIKADDSGDMWQNFSHIVDVSSVSAKDQYVLVIVDDNMYYRSMRYQYYQLARKYAYGFCESYVKCPLIDALARNRERSKGRVNEDVIVAMETKLEAPDRTNYNWEKYSLVVTSREENCCFEILSLVRAAMLDPVKAPEDDTEDRLESRRVCSSNTVHQADQIIRKLLAQQLKTAKGEGKTKEEMKVLSTRFSNIKAAILNDMRSGVITFDTDVKDASKDESSELFRFVQIIFHKRISLLR